jgi:hypothetical protein
VREDPVHRSDAHFALSQATFELSGLHQPGSPDREFLESGLGKGWFIPEQSPDSNEWGEGDEGWSVPDPPDSLEELMVLVVGSVFRWASERCANWDTVTEDYLTVLNACIQSEFVLIDWEFAYWLAPDSSKWRGRQRHACERLAATRDLWQGGYVPVIDPLLDREPRQHGHPFLGFSHEGQDALPVLRAVRAVTSDERGALTSEIETFVEELTSVWIPVRDFSRPADDEQERVRAPLSVFSGSGDPWLRRKGDQEGVHPKIRDACSTLADEATRIAPGLVSRDYEIVVGPLLAGERVAFAGAKVQVALRSRQSGRLFDLDVVGSGVRVWAQYSLREAMRSLREAEEAIPERRSIYVLDEPERHLHPSAQTEIAAWLAERVRDGAHVLMATHAIPFLNIPYEGTEYFRVFRDEVGLTRACLLYNLTLPTKRIV